MNYVGEILKPMENTPLYVEKMSTFQTDIYMEYWKKDAPKEVTEEEVDDDSEEEKVYNELYNNSIQSSLMVFPNKTFGLKDLSALLCV